LPGVPPGLARSAGAHPSLITDHARRPRCWPTPGAGAEAEIHAAIEVNQSIASFATIRFMSTPSLERSPERPRPQRSDGESSRARLLEAGLRLFARQGFANTSTREIAEAAQVNIAAISYYFGDKAGLYRAAFFEPLAASSACPVPPATGAAMPLPDALQLLFGELLAPMRAGELAQLCIALHFREMVEPTGLWQEEIENEIRPMHLLLVQALVAHFGLAEPDDDVRRLAVSIAGLAVHLHVGRDVIETLAPSIAVGPHSLDTWIDRLSRYALAMVESDRQRRAEAPPADPAAGRG
jgi:TetR/AcrR family transcriptional regulator, regulator of cefoperazone and chloramphenicol sensitivity